MLESQLFFATIIVGVIIIVGVVLFVTMSGKQTSSPPQGSPPPSPNPPPPVNESPPATESTDQPMTRPKRRSAANPEFAKTQPNPIHIMKTIEAEQEAKTERVNPNKNVSETNQQLPPVPPGMAMEKSEAETETVTLDNSDVETVKMDALKMDSAEAETVKMEPLDESTEKLDDIDDLPATQETPILQLSWQVAALTDVGLKRELNEDNWGKAEMIMPDQQPCGLYIVADGMGGHEGGEIASNITVQAIREQFLNNPPSTDSTTFEDWLKEATNIANEAVITEQGDRQQRSEKMGSTLVMALVFGNQAYIANVGDSRAYLLNDTIRKITADHSLVERLVELGQITAEEARNHPQRNVIYSTMGDREKMHVDVYRENLQSGDRLLLCSDGLSGMVEDEDLLQISQTYNDPEDVCRAMIEAAKEGGGKDNITAIIIQMSDA